MKDTAGIPQLFLRIALGLGFILPVMDRLGYLGAPGSGKVAWGDWSHFIDYTNTLIPFLNRPLANVMGLLATTGEAIVGVCLLIGYKTKIAALGGALITLLFAICMIGAINIGAPFKYPVFVFTGAGLVLSGLNTFKWSIDQYLNNRSTINK